MSSLTGATAIYALGVTGLYTVPQQLQGFAADDVFSTEAIQSAEVLMGVDGNLSAGFVYVPVVQNISLQADSPSNDLFDQWWAAQQAAEETYIANALITLKAIGKKWTLTRGFLTKYSPVPDTKKLIQPRQYGITWNRVSPAPV